MSEAARFDINPDAVELQWLQQRYDEWRAALALRGRLLAEVEKRSPDSRGFVMRTRAGYPIGVDGIHDEHPELAPPPGWVRFKKNRDGKTRWLVPMRGPDGDEARALIADVPAAPPDLATYLGLPDVHSPGRWYSWGYEFTDGPDNGVGPRYVSKVRFRIDSGAVTPETLAAAKVELPSWLRRLVPTWEPA